MQDSNYIISDYQAKQIANCIYLDIANYIEKNKTKYEQWLIERKNPNEQNIR